MSLTVGELNARLSLDKDSFDRGLDTSEGRFRGFAGKIGKVAAGAGIAVGAAIGAAAIKGVASFASLESGMNEVFTLLPGISDDAMKEMTDQVKGFSKEFGVLPDEVVPALYQSLSAGVPQDNVFEFLEVAQKAAKGGVTDLTTAVDGISSVVNAYGSDVIGATEASDLMFTAVRLGKTNFEEMSNSLFNVIPTASSLGVEFGDVTAALATMTAQGTPTSVATTQIRQALVEMSKAGSKSAEIFEEAAGTSFREFIAQGGNLQEALGIMSGAADEMGVSVSDLFGSVEAGSAVLSLTSETGAQAYASALSEMDSSAGATEAANEQMSQGLTDSWNKIKAAVAVGTASFGEKLAPTVQRVVDWVLENWPKMSEKVQEVMTRIQEIIGPIVEWIREFWEENGEEILAFLEETWTAIQEVISAAMEFIQAVIDRVLIIVTAIWETHGERIMKFLSGVWDRVKVIIENALGFIKSIFKAFAALFRGDWSALWEHLKDAFGHLWEVIKSAISNALETLKLIFTIALDGLLVAWEFVWDKMSSFLSGVWEGIKSMIRNSINTVMGWIESFVNNLIGGINKASGLLNKLPGVNIGTVSELSLPRLHQGGTVAGVPGEEMAAILRAGEKVVDSGASVLPGGSVDAFGSGAQINVTVPSREAREIAREIAFVQEFEMKVATG